ncbi:MAG: threonine synthase [Clostridiales bacterium]|nr:threonine synthase [Clostridiales bacterium]
MSRYKLKCINCGKIYDPTPDRYTCDDCGDLLGTLEVIYDLKNMHLSKDTFDKKAGIFQFKDLLPVSSHTAIDEFIGGTPLLKFKNLLNQNEVLIKYDGISFSSSYKDRASIIAINKAIELNYNSIYCASTGNAASSLALLSAHTNLNTYIFVPSKIPKGKLSQLLVAGAEVIPVKATYDEVFDISLNIGRQKGWYCRNSAINPYLLEGKKTGAYEILIQNDYIAPDYCLVGVGDGTVISSLCKGFKEFYELGLTDKIPKVIGVQATQASTLKHVYDKGEPFIPIQEDVSTIADSISVGNPRDVIKACKFVKSTNGYFISVDDEEIISAIKEMAATTGIFAEPAGAVSYAGLKNMIKNSTIKKDDSVCIVVTGNGLKDIDAVGKNTNVTFYTKDEVYEKMKEE